MRHALIIDDSRAIRLAIRRILEGRGFVVDEAEDGDQALAWCRTNGAVDVILCDIDMPNLDGLQFVRALRGDPALAQPPVIMCTTHTAFERIVEALDAGANEYVMKPFDSDIIGSKLAQVGVA